MQRRTFMNMTGARWVRWLHRFARATKASEDSVAYPDPAMEIVDPRFAKYRIPSAAVERLYTGTRWAEGPVWFGDGRYLLFSDIPNNRMLRWLEDTGEVSVFRSPSNYSNGNSRDRQGRLLTCEHDTRRLTRTEHDGTITVLMDTFKARRSTRRTISPCIPTARSGSPIPATGSCRTTKATKPLSNFPPSSIASIRKRAKSPSSPATWTSPTAFVSLPTKRSSTSSDTGARSIQRSPPDPCLRRRDGARLKNGRMFVDMSPGSSDGIRCDVDGNLWSAAGWGPDKIQRRARLRARRHIDRQDPLPETCANLCFGGAKKNRLFMAASQSLYAVYVGTEGAQVP